MAKAKAARLLLKAGKSLLKRRNLLKVPKGKLTIPQKIKKVETLGAERYFLNRREGCKMPSAILQRMLFSEG